jgi:hypothetical protein
LRLRLAIALVLSAALALAVFTPAVMTGRHEALHAPQGDQAQALAGAYYFYRDAWRWPLFEVAVPGASQPANIAYSDSVPLLALAGKVWFRLTGEAINFIAPWLWVCVLGQAVAITLLLDELGLRRLPETLAGVVLVAVMPAFLFRYWMWHPALCGHFVLVLALALTLRTQRTGLRPQSAWPWAALMVTALWIHPYFLGMTAPFFLLAAGSVALRATGRARFQAIAGAATAGIALVAALVVGGYLQGGHLRGNSGFGVYSMNVLAPFGAMGKSGILPGGGHFARATDGQMEGFNYLGWGIFFGIGAAALACVGRQGAALRRDMRSHWPMAVLLVALTLFAISTTVYVGAYQVASVALPTLLDRVAGVFRSSGRFFWPVAYALLAFALFGIARGYRASVAACLPATIVALQWLDTAVLRTVIITEKPADPVASNPAIAGLVASHAAVSIHPTVGCTQHKDMMPAAFALQFLAAREGKSLNSLSEARRGPDCDAEARKLGQMTLTPETLVVLGTPYDAAYVAARGWQSYCQAIGKLHLCSAQLKQQT